MRLKRIVLVMLAGGLALAVAGCSSASSSLSEDDDGTEVTVKVGEKLVVELPSNPTTGFAWTVADDGPLAQVGEAEYASDAKPGVVGAGGTETFTFEAKEAGSGALVVMFMGPVADTSTPGIGGASDRDMPGVPQPARTRRTASGT